MNKVLISVVAACGLLLVVSPEASAHEEYGPQQRSHAYDHPEADRRHSNRRDVYVRDSYHRDRYRGDHHNARHHRAKQMPRWLKRDRSFRHWFEHSRLRKNRRLSWDRLFDLYRWENAYFRYRRY